MQTIKCEQINILKIMPKTKNKVTTFFGRKFFFVNFRANSYGLFCCLDSKLSFDTICKNPIMLTRVMDSWLWKNPKAHELVF